MLHDIVDARYLNGYRLYLRFDDGAEGELDLASLVRFDGVFAPLADPRRFAEVRVNPDTGTIEWPNGADIAPETLYEAISAPPDKVAAAR